MPYQKFYQAYITLTKDKQVHPDTSFTPSEIEEACESLDKALLPFDSERRHSYINECRIQSIDHTNDTLSIELKGDPYYYIAECTVEPYYPGTMWKSNGDPGDPPEGGAVHCYHSTLELLNDIWKLPEGWQCEVIEEQFQNENNIVDNEWAIC